MQTTYRLKAHEISMTFLKSLKTLFAGQEIEITIKAVEPGDQQAVKNNQKIAEMLLESRTKAPVISSEVDIRMLIDQSQHPDH